MMDQLKQLSLIFMCNLNPSPDLRRNDEKKTCLPAGRYSGKRDQAPENINLLSLSY